MPELFEERDDTFWETMGQTPDPEPAPDTTDTAVAEVVADEAPASDADTATDETQDTRARDEHGRFIREEKTPEEKLGEKFKTDDDVRAAYLELQRLYGDQTRELGETRKIFEERLASIDSKIGQPAPQAITEEFIERDPARATQLAYEQGNTAALQYAFDAWAEENPVAASAWRTDRVIEQRDAEWQARYDDLAGRVQPAEQQAENNLLAAGLRDLNQSDPGWNERVQANADKIEPEIAGALFALVDSGTPAQKIGAFKALARLTRDQPQADTREQAEQLARKTVEDTERAIAEAAVITGGGAVTPPPRSAADRIGDEWDALEAPAREGFLPNTRR